MTSEPNSRSGPDSASIILSEALAEQARRDSPPPQWLLLALFLAMVLVFPTLGATAGIIVYKANCEAEDANQLRLEWRADLERERSLPTTTSSST
jgi:hypothetical protein